MDKQQKIKSEVEKTLLSLDALQEQKLSPYFYTRVQASIDNARSLPTKWSFAVKLVVAMLLIANTILFIDDQQSKVNEDAVITELRSDYGFENLYVNIEE